ncbi:MAG TPA: hypothetical protein VMV95_04295 [Bacillota bacterium]|nr:hypothetical protein [Bacillota bacterium]
MKRKKSNLGVVSHVGVVLSFVIFITFIIFIYIVIRPAIETEDKQAILDYVKGVIIENASANMISVSVSIFEASNTCVNLMGFLDGLEIGNRITAGNYEGDVFDTKISIQNLYVEKNSGEKFLKVYGSDAFDLTENGAMSECQQANEGYPGYWVGFVQTEKNIFEKKIIQIIEDYNSDYENLKEELNIPLGNDFRLSFTYANGTFIETEEKEASGSVFIEEISIRYINKNLSKEAGYLGVGIW